MSNYICKYCGRDCKNAGGLAAHIPYCKNNPNKQVHKYTNVRRGKYAKIQTSCPYCDKQLNTTKQLIEKHIAYCKCNPNHKNFKPMSEETKQKISIHQQMHPRKVSEKHKQKLSKLAKQRKLGGYKKGSGRGKKGWYNGFWCDSTYELAYVIYCLDHDINIQRNYDSFEYILDNNIHKYTPDFIVDNTYIEIKGYHTKLVDIKLACVNKPIKILYGKDLDYIFKYIEQTYNKCKDKNISDLYNGVKTEERLT